MLNEFALKFWKVSEEFLTEPRRNAASDLSRFFFSRVFVNSFHCIRKYWGKWKNMYVWTQFYGNNRRYAYLVMACIEMRNIKFVYKVNRLANENHTFFFFLFFLPTEKSTKVSEETPNFLPVRLTQLLCQFLLVPNAYEPSVLRSRFFGMSLPRNGCEWDYDKPCINFSRRSLWIQFIKYSSFKYWDMSRDCPLYSISLYS